MENDQKKNIIVALGVGRTGTSLLMQVLQKLGMSVSENMNPASEQNIMGFYEDREIFAIHTELLKILKTNQLYPLPDGWLSVPGILSKKNQLSEILTERIASSRSLWGFKDPRTAIFLPLWFQAFNSAKISAKYILALRSPASTVRSLKTQYNQDEKISELCWLYKNCEALTSTASNCFIVHYEDWFKRSVAQAEALLYYTGLDKFFVGNVNDVLEGVICSNLNRSIYDEYEVSNEYVRRLYDVLKDCRGDDFDRVELMKVVKDCRKAMDGFKGWYREAQKFYGQQLQLRQEVENQRQKFDIFVQKASVEQARAERQAKQIEAEQARAERQAKQIEAEQARAEKQAKQIEAEQARAERQAKQIEAEKARVESQAKQIEELQKAVDELVLEVDLVRNSLSWKLGNTLIDAFRRPGRNMLRLPYDVFKLAKESSKFGHKKQMPVKRVVVANSTTEMSQQRRVSSANHLDKIKQKKESLILEYKAIEKYVFSCEEKAKISDVTSALASDLTESVLKANKILHQIKDVDDEIMEFRIRTCTKRDRSSSRQVKTNIRQSHQEVGGFSRWRTVRKKFVLGVPDSERLRAHFIAARKRPGKNTVLFPLRLIKHFLEVMNSKVSVFRNRR